jgi:AP endonuclease-1
LAGTSDLSFSFKAKGDKCTRFTTWNVNGIMWVDEKILKKYMEAENSSILILTVTKYSETGFDVLQEAFQGKPPLINLNVI